MATNHRARNVGNTTITKSTCRSPSALRAVGLENHATWYKAQYHSHSLSLSSSTLTFLPRVREFYMHSLFTKILGFHSKNFSETPPSLCTMLYFVGQRVDFQKLSEGSQTFELLKISWAWNWTFLKNSGPTNLQNGVAWNWHILKIYCFVFCACF